MEDHLRSFFGGAQKEANGTVAAATARVFVPPSVDEEI